MKSRLFAILFFIATVGYGQVPIADFTFEDNACLGANVSLQNLSTNADEYFWDFCPGDFNDVPSINSYINRAGLSQMENITIYKEKVMDSLMYVFIASGSGDVFRGKLNNYFSSVPTLNAITRAGFTFSRPIDFDVIKLDDKYFGYMADFTASRIYEYDFGTSLDNDPVITNLGSFSSINQPFGLRAVIDEGKVKLLVSNYGANYLTLLTRSNLGEYSSQNIVTGTNQGWGIDLINFNGNWIVSIAYRTANLTKFIDLGPVLNGSVTSSFNLTHTELTNPTNVQLLIEASELNCIVKSNANGLFRVLFGSSFSISPFVQKYGNLEGIILNTSTKGFHIIQKLDSDWEGLIVQSTSVVNKLQFNSNCNLPTAISIDADPTFISSTPGTYSINLTAKNSSGAISSIIKPLTVTENTAPLGSILANNAYCIENPIELLLETEDEITDFLWSFGDGNFSTEIAPSHTYLSAGAYTVAVTVTSPEGCSNTYDKEIIVYDTPVADFATEQPSYCSFGLIDFQNQTEGDFGEHVIWSWDFNGNGVSSEQNSVFVFETQGTKTVTLTANVLGCQSVALKTIEIVEGPQVDFLIGSACFGQSVNFTDLSLGSDIISYAWDFSNGEYSEEQNPFTVYGESGNYTVKLTVTNDSGCENHLEKQVSVHEQIIEQIAISEVVENVPFTASVDLIPESGQLITSYAWELEDLVSSEASPVFSLSKTGVYELSLTIETGEGCSFYDTVSFSVLPSSVPIADFAFKINPCLAERIEISNLSVNAQSYEWDFCPGNFDDPPSISALIDNTELSQLENVLLYRENVFDNSYYLFIASGKGEVYRGITNDNIEILSPLEALPKSGLTFTRPIDFTVVKFQAIYYGYMIDFLTHTLYEYYFGGSLSNSPTVKDLGTFTLNQPYGLKAVVDEGKIKVLVSNLGTSNLTLVTKNGEDEYVKAEIPTGTAQGWGIDLIRHQERWMAAVAFRTTSQIKLLDLGTTITDQVYTNTTLSHPNLTNPTNLRLLREGSNISMIAKSNSNGLFRLAFGDNFSSSPAIQQYGNLGVLNTSTRGFDIVQNGSSQWNGVIVQAERIVNKISFEKECHVVPALVIDSLATVTYSAPGSYPITLTAYHANGNYNSITKEITVEDKAAPIIDFDFSSNRCVDTEISFTHSSNQSLSNTQWSFGDGNTSEVPDPIHHFTDDGLYHIRLDVENENGCTNFIEKPITIYPEPIPSFTFPEGTLCSNSSIPFTNTSEIGGAQEVVQWQWDFNEEGVSDLRDPEFNFSQGGAKMVSLTATIPGCSPKTTQWFNVTAGPEVQFSVQNQCFGEELQFVNESTGEGITQYHWLLGNGQTSFEADPSLLYDTAGTYPVQLEVTNEMGCTNALEKDILVHFNPVADMEYGLLCSSGTHFIDKSTVNRANLTKWEWSILQDGQYQLLSNQKNPMIETGTAGIHRLKLNVASNFGCSDSKEVEIDALPGPEADFATSAICVGDSVLFTDLSVSLQNNPVTQWYWNINGKGFFTQQPKSLFQTPGAYQVSLKVDAQNLCSDMITKTVVVPRLPVPVFTTSKLCQNEHILFADKSFSPDDPVKSWEWDFAGLATKTGPQAQFQFPTAKDHAVKLSVVTENGCRQFMVNTVSINPAPKAKFSLYPAVGTVPLPVTLENQSIGAVNYRWTFGEHADSVVTDFQPDYTYQSLGEHEIKLLAISDKGCRDSVSQMISIRLPLLDVELERILKVVNNGELQLVTRINNLGSLIIQDMDLVIDLGSIKLRESFPEILEAGEGVNHPLNFRISDFIAQGLEYVCITLEPRMPGNQEVSLENNKMCISLNELFSILEPFPNPVNTELNISYIATNTSDGVSMLVADLTGRVVLDKKVQPQQTGMNHHLLDVRGLSGGMYVIKIAVNDKVIIRRVLVER